MSDVTANADIPAGDGERRHDPLCPAPLCDWTGESGNDCIGYEDCQHLCQCNLIARVREDERMRDDDYAYVATQSYASALRDAQVAIEEYLSEGTCPDCSFTIRDQEIVAAIEALGGER